MHTYIFIKHGIIFYVTLPTVGRVSRQTRKSSHLWLVHNPERHVEVYLNNQRICLFHANSYILSLMNFIMKENFQTNSFTPNINTRNTHHLHTPNASLSCFKKIFSSLPCCVTILKNDKYLNPYTFYFVDEFFIRGVTI